MRAHTEPSPGPATKRAPAQWQPHRQLDSDGIHRRSSRSNTLKTRPFGCPQEPGGDSNFSMLLTLNYESREVNLKAYLCEMNLEQATWTSPSCLLLPNTKFIFHPVCLFVWDVFTELYIVKVLHVQSKNLQILCKCKRSHPTTFFSPKLKITTYGGKGVSF